MLQIEEMENFHERFLFNFKFSFDIFLSFDAFGCFFAANEQGYFPCALIKLAFTFIYRKTDEKNKNRLQASDSTINRKLWAKSASLKI